MLLFSFELKMLREKGDWLSEVLSDSGQELLELKRYTCEL